MMDTKEKLEATAKTLGEVAVFADYLKVLAIGAGQTAKADKLEGQAVDLRDWEHVYVTAADATDV